MNYYMPARVTRWFFLALLAVAAGLAPQAARAQAPRPIVRLDLQGSGMLTDQTHVYFQAGATTGFDSSFDASKLPNPSGLNIASVMGTQQYSINGLPPLNATPLSVLLFVGVPAYGSYQIRVGQFDNLTSPAVWLRDAQLNTRTRLALGTTITLSFTNTYTAVNRLYLEFDALLPAAAAASAPALQPQLWPNPAQGSFSLRLPTADATRAVLLDALGRSVRSIDLPRRRGALTLPVDVRGLPPGYYRVRVLGPGKAAASLHLVLE
ncbi:hypothetical protein GCM10023185_40890 [Hymenobacter saemangeumensis]|uniref:T9SS type A sorting domain-containing protein n=1 Tax=Hymenobacter saemangeumensis TaxID=1084522 RepID=A0ABP8IR91_9BACT